MKISEILNIDYPIIQGGMANIADGKFAASVSDTGALGVIGAGAMSARELRDEIRICQSLTSKPFGVNLMLLHPEIEEQARIVVETGVKIVTTGAGNPASYIEYWKENGLKVLPVISSPALAVRLARMGVDGLIAEGSEGGGHVGEMTSMTLLPQVKALVKLPIIAAGGIGSGSQMLAAKALGADGVQLGTLLLASQECPIHENYKQALLRAKDRSVVVIGRIAGIPVRLLRNSMTKDYIRDEKQGASKEELELYVLGALKRAVREGDVKRGSLMAGLVAPQIKEILPLKEIIEGLYRDYLKEWRDLSNDYRDRE